MHIVYILRSQKDRNRFYIGLTNDLNRRLNEHKNAEGKTYTVRYAPWRLETYLVFQNKKLAEDFEVYLKGHSGRAFLKKRLLSC